MSNMKKTINIFLILCMILLALPSLSGATEEEERNKQIATQCQEEAMQVNLGNGQTTPLCQQATLYRCYATKFSSLYPDKVDGFNSNADKTCQILAQFGASCNACQ